MAIQKLFFLLAVANIAAAALGGFSAQIPSASVPPSVALVCTWAMGFLLGNTSALLQFSEARRRAAVKIAA